MIGCLDVDDILMNRVDEQIPMISEENQPITQRAQVRIAAQCHAFGDVQECCLCFTGILGDGFCCLRVFEVVLDVADILGQLALGQSGHPNLRDHAAPLFRP